MIYVRAKFVLATLLTLQMAVHILAVAGLILTKPQIWDYALAAGRHENIWKYLTKL